MFLLCFFMTRYIFVIGGVMSSVGKGITVGAVGKLLQCRGFRVTGVKIDPYINVDAGTMNPTEHGEVFVTEDGDECDQDIGNYERFLNTDLTSENYMTQGRVLRTVIERERNLEYGGKCVQIIPHVPQEIIKRIEKAGKLNKADFVIVEIGGTIGEYENLLFLEAARMMHLRDPNTCQFILVSYMPIPKHVGEMKSKPTQHAARSVNSAGIQPDFIVCRGEQSLDRVRKQKLSLFCNVQDEDVISAPDVDSIYEIPMLLEKEKIGANILKKFGIKPRKPKLDEWTRFVKTIGAVSDTLKIGVVGKYFGTGNYTLSDSYISVIESVKFACWHHKRKPVLDWIDSTDFEQDPGGLKLLSKYDGIIVPGGFGSRGIEGIMRAIGYVRKKKIPYLGLCYGMQLACIEIARNVAGLDGAHTVEVEKKTKHSIIHINPLQLKNVKNKQYGGTMRLGSYDCSLLKGSIAHKAYGVNKVSERHRHRYEFNNAYKKHLEKAGVRFSGINKENNLVEIIELTNHPFFVGVQFHPEFKSRPLAPHPLFRDFVGSMLAS